MMTMRVDRRRYRKSARRSNSMNFSGTEDQADKKVSSASSSTGYSRDYGRKRSRSYPYNSSAAAASPWDSIAPMPTPIRASAKRKSNLLFNSSLDGENGLSEDQNLKKITESNLLYINLIATSVEPQWLAEMGPMSFSDTSMLDHKKKQEQEMTDMEEEMENLRYERKKRAKEQQRVSMPGLKSSGSSTYFRPKKLWL